MYLTTSPGTPQVVANDLSVLSTGIRGPPTLCEPFFFFLNIYYINIAAAIFFLNKTAAFIKKLSPPHPQHRIGHSNTNIGGVEMKCVACLTRKARVALKDGA